MAEVRQLMAQGQHEAALARVSALVAGRSIAGPEHAILIQLLFGLNRRAEANAALDAAAALKITSGDAADALGFFARHLDRHELSHSLYREGTRLAPGDARMWFNLATSERSLGNLDAAAAAVKEACRLDPDLTGAILLRSEVSRATADANNVEALRRDLSRLGAKDAQINLSYALGKELHDLKRYDEAFGAFAHGAATRRGLLNYDVAMDEAKMARIEETFADAAGVAARSHSAARHVFIIGLPRSGTTLTERILGSLPDVRSNNETNNFANALIKHSADKGSDVFERAAHADFAAVGRDYEVAAAGLDGFAGTIIEKLPFNYLYVGAILSAIPDAAIVSLRRHPLDTCFAMFRTLFAAAYPFSYRFDELARYFAAYERLMRHWEAIFPGRITFVAYEDLVRDPARFAPPVAQGCGLPWSDEALRIDRNRSASLTASASQVREGIYTTSAGGWRNYREHLAPLAAALREQGVEFED